MSFEVVLILYCDNCGVEENYGENFPSLEVLNKDLPAGWAADYDDGDEIFKHACGPCVELLEAE